MFLYSSLSHPPLPSLPPPLLPSLLLPSYLVITVLLDLRRKRAAEIPYKLLTRPEADALYKKVSPADHVTWSCDLVYLAHYPNVLILFSSIWLTVLSLRLSAASRGVGLRVRPVMWRLFITLTTIFVPVTSRLW